MKLKSFIKSLKPSTGGYYKITIYDKEFDTIFDFHEYYKIKDIKRLVGGLTNDFYFKLFKKLYYRI